MDIIYNLSRFILCCSFFAFDDLYVDSVVIYSVWCQSSFITLSCFFLLALIIIFSVYEKRLAEKSVSDMNYSVSSDTLKHNSINQSINQSGI